MKKELVDKHLKLVLEANKTLNLTRISDYQQAQTLHIKDSLSALNLIKSQVDGHLLDMGSGAGYPGIPLAIYSERKTTLCETVKKKADCLKSFIKELELTNQIEVFNGRIEELAKIKSNFYQVITARALASTPSLLELASPLLKTGGILIAFKSKDIDLKPALEIQNIFGLEYEKSIDTIKDHQLIIFKKVFEPKIKLPRKAGFAQKKPMFHMKH